MKLLTKALGITVLGAAMAMTMSAKSNSNQNTGLAVIDFKACVENSKLGKEEQKSFETLKAHMVASLEKIEKELKELAEKFDDSDYMDSLSEEGQQELQNQFRTLQEQYNRDQNSFYQTLNQANYKFVQGLQQEVNKAAESISKDKGYKAVLNQEATFFHAPEVDITSEVVAQMDKQYDNNNKKDEK